MLELALGTSLDSCCSTAMRVVGFSGFFFRKFNPFKDKRVKLTEKISENPTTLLGFQQHETSEVPSASSNTNRVTNINGINHYVDMKTDTFITEQKFLPF